jgi:hypothetical protein
MKVVSSGTQEAKLIIKGQGRVAVKANHEVGLVIAISAPAHPQP